MRFFAHHKGLLLGDSSGMLLYYSMKYIKDTPKSNEIKKMVLIIGDSGESYLAHAFNDGWMIKNELINKQIINDLSEFYI